MASLPAVIEGHDLYSEFTRLSTGGLIVFSEVQDRIDQMFRIGIWAHVSAPDRTTYARLERGKRPTRARMRRGFYREVAWECLRVITGDPAAGTYFFPVNDGHGQMDVSLHWLLEKNLEVAEKLAGKKVSSGCCQRRWRVACAEVVASNAQITR